MSVSGIFFAVDKVGRVLCFETERWGDDGPPRVTVYCDPTDLPDIDREAAFVFSREHAGEPYGFAGGAGTLTIAALPEPLRAIVGAVRYGGDPAIADDIWPRDLKVPPQPRATHVLLARDLGDHVVAFLLANRMDQPKGALVLPIANCPVPLDRVRVYEPHPDGHGLYRCRSTGKYPVSETGPLAERIAALTLPSSPEFALLEDLSTGEPEPEPVRDVPTRTAELDRRVVHRYWRDNAARLLTGKARFGVAVARLMPGEDPSLVEGYFAAMDAAFDALAAPVARALWVTAISDTADNTPLAGQLAELGLTQAELITTKRAGEAHLLKAAAAWLASVS